MATTTGGPTNSNGSSRAFIDDRGSASCTRDFVDFTRTNLSDSQLVNVRRFHPQTPRRHWPSTASTMPQSSPRDRDCRKGGIQRCRVLRRKLVSPGEDTEMCLRIAERWQFQHVPGGLTFKRRHAHNSTRHLETLLPINVALTQRFVARNPSLEPFIGQRLSRRYARVGHDCARRGQSPARLRICASRSAGTRRSSGGPTRI